MQPLINDGWLMGASVAVAHRDVTELYHFGRTTLTGAPPVDNTLYELGSISKAFTGVLLATLLEEEALFEDAAVSTLLPSSVLVPARNGVVITLGDLASHHSGLPRLPANLSPSDASNPYADYSVTQLYAELTGTTLSVTPGTRYEYSNLGTGLLGHALGLHLEMDFQDAVKARITVPLGMHSTTVTLSAQEATRLAQPHDPDLVPVTPWDMPTLQSAGGLRSSIWDMAVFARANLGGANTVLEAALQRSHLPLHPLNGGGSIALGWHLLSNGTVWHNGSTFGSATMMAVDVENQVAVVLLANTGAYSVTAAGMALMRAVLQGVAEPLTLPRAVTLSETEMERCVGRYSFGGNTVVSVRRSGTFLELLLAGNPPLRLYAEDALHFFLRVAEISVSFTANGAGEITAITYDEGAGEQTGMRLP